MGIFSVPWGVATFLLSLYHFPMFYSLLFQCHEISPRVSDWGDFASITSSETYLSFSSHFTYNINRFSFIMFLWLYIQSFFTGSSVSISQSAMVSLTLFMLYSNFTSSIITFYLLGAPSPFLAKSFVVVDYPFLKYPMNLSPENREATQ